jgi:hypothetical protein
MHARLQGRILTWTSQEVLIWKAKEKMKFRGDQSLNCVTKNRKDRKEGIIKGTIDKGVAALCARAQEIADSTRIDKTKTGP